MHLLERGVARVGRAGQARGQHALEARREGVARQAGEVGLAARDAADDVGACCRPGRPSGTRRARRRSRRPRRCRRGGRACGPIEELRAPGSAAPRRAAAAVLERLQVPRAEVDELHLARRREPHVRWLEVEVQHALAVRVGEALAHLSPHVEHALDRQQRAAAQHLARGSRPGTNSVATQGQPSWSPTPSTAAMFGCPRAPAACASRFSARDGAGHVLRSGVEELDRGRAVVLRVPARRTRRRSAPRPSSPRTSKGPNAFGASRRPPGQGDSIRFAEPARRVLSWPCYPWRRALHGHRHRPRPRGDRARRARALERFGERFVSKLMDPEEAAALPASPPERSLALALAVAGKEAASKALGTGWSQGVRWRDVVVTAGPEPRVRLDGRAAAVARARGSSGRSRLRLERGRSARDRRVLAAFVTARPRSRTRSRGATCS